MMTSQLVQFSFRRQFYLILGSKERKSEWIRFYDFKILFQSLWERETENDTGFPLSCWSWSFFLRFTIESFGRFSDHIHQFFGLFLFLFSRQKT